MIRSPLTNINKPLSSGSGARKTYTLKPKKKSMNRLRSLVVDNDKTILKYVVQVLIRFGHQAETANKKNEVVNKLNTGIYDLMITDLEMPEMNGYHLSRSIKRIYDIKVIIMTGRYQSDCLEMMAAQWVDGWLFKPFGLDDMRARLQGLGLLKD
jgi:CheY-like chemotaxis protein